MAFNNTLPTCENAPLSAFSDAGVAGAGILLAFIITAGLALGYSSFIVLSEIRGRSSRNISRKILSGLSDQMIVEGLAIQIVGLARVNSMIPYHFFVIASPPIHHPPSLHPKAHTPTNRHPSPSSQWMLSLLATATNFATLLALVQDFKRDWVLRWLRQIGMFINLALTVVFGIFVLQANMRNLAPTLPIACVWQSHAKDTASQSSSALSLAGTIAVIAVSCIIFVLGTWYLHMPKQTWGKVVRVVSLLLLTGMAIGAAARVVVISQAFGGPQGPPVVLADEGEKPWSFGQLLTMLLLVLPFVSALEIYRGEMVVPRANKGCDGDQIPLTASEEEYKTASEGLRGFRTGR